ncbi:MAG: YncE family protein [Terracidiphilus sp.]|nr:YncE family protein [Terracidiphilus sp.]
MQIVRFIRSIVLPAASLAISLAVSAQQPYKLLDRWTIGGEGGWDYLVADAPAHRLYITHNARVEVVDTSTGKPIGAITGLHGTHGVALLPDGKLGYISDGAANQVAVFDRSTLTIAATIPAGTNPDGILYEPSTATVWAFNGRSHSASVIDTTTQKVIATVPLPGKPEFPVADGQGTIFVNIEDKNQIVCLDARTHQITATWAAGCESPSGLAFDVTGHRLFPVCDGNKMAVVDSLTGKLLATPAIGDGPDAAGFSAAHNLAFASSGDGILAIVDATAPNYPTLQKLATQSSARTMTYDPASDRIYLVAAQFGPRPAPTAQTPKPRPTVLSGSFTVLVVGRN